MKSLLSLLAVVCLSTPAFSPGRMNPDGWIGNLGVELFGDIQTFDVEPAISGSSEGAPKPERLALGIGLIMPVATNLTFQFRYTRFDELNGFDGASLFPSTTTSNRFRLSVKFYTGS